ncbi:MAG: ATP-binding protein [Myxococcota bacterium]|jgi:signal transduction histidine kinase|nr:ATP-binding protein [Myxococcota bacterium]
MNDVSCRAFGPALVAMEHRGIPIEALTEGLPVSASDLSTTRNRVSWDVLVEVADRLVDLFGSAHALEEAYYEYFRSLRKGGMVPRVMRLFFSPRDIYRAGTHWFGPSLFSIIEGRFEDLPGGGVRETLTIPEQYADCPNLFQFMRAGLRAAPSFIGLPDAEVKLEMYPRRAVYTIEFENRHPRLRSFFRRTSEWPDPIVEIIVEQQSELQAAFDELREAKGCIEKQAASLDRANRELRGQNEILEERVRERTSVLEQANDELASEVEVRKSAMADLVMSRERLKVAERLVAQGTFAAGIAHEINNPVAAILLAAQYAMNSQELPHAVAIYLQSFEDIECEARRCGEIVESVLQFAREEPTAKWVTDLNDVAHRAFVNVGPYAKERGAVLHEAEPAAACYMRMNPLQIEQAVENVLRNAIESTKLDVEVKLSTEERDGRAFIRVEDSGTGIPEPFKGRIFDPFFTTRRHDGHRGLGLSVAYGNVSEHDGRIHVEEIPNGGTRVSIELETGVLDREAEGEEFD